MTGQVPINFIVGSTEADRLIGTSGPDFMEGLAGNDTLFGGLGDDILAGQDGNDTALVSGTFSEYLMAFSSDGEDRLLIGPDGTDTLQSIEFIQFDDVAVAVDFYRPFSQDSTKLIGGNTVTFETVVIGSTDGDWGVIPLYSINIEIQRPDGTIVNAFSARTFAADEPRTVREPSKVAVVALPDGGFFFDFLVSGLYTSYETLSRSHFSEDGSLVSVENTRVDYFSGFYEGQLDPGMLPQAVTLDGNLVQGAELTADATSLIAQFGELDLGFQWLRNGTEIEGATSQTYTLRQADVGQQVHVSVQFTDDTNAVQTLGSALSDPIENVNDVPEGMVAIVGALQSGQQVMVDTTGLTDPDGIPEGAIHVQWLRDGIPIEGATAPQLTLTLADIGAELRVEATYTDAFGSHETVLSSASAPVESDPEATVTAMATGGLLRGSERAEYLLGLGADDVMLGEGGADRLDGGAGDDILLADPDFAPLMQGAAQSIYRLYLATLNRVPDREGLSDWTEKLVTGVRDLPQIVEGFIYSREFQNTYGNLTNDAFIELLYQNVLGRASDAAGKQSWLDAMAGGASMSDVVLGFSESREYKTATQQEAETFLESMAAGTWSDDVYRLYRATLDRDPDAEGFMGWSERLASGESLTDVAAGFVGSREFQRDYGGLDDEGFVTLLYQNVLGRAPDNEGLRGWVSILEAGATRTDVLLGFSQSTEFILRSNQDLLSWMHREGADDILLGGEGTDTMVGGALADQFVFQRVDQGTSQVLDLEPWDQLVFKGFGYTTPEEALSHMSQNGADVVFADQGVTVTLLGIDLTLMDPQTILL